MKKMFFVVIAAFAALFSFGFCDALVFAQLTVTEVSNANILGEDWFELTNTSETTVDLTGFFWDDDGPMGNDGAIFGDVSLEPGESLIVLEGSEIEDGIETAFRDIYSLDAEIQVFNEDDFTGNDTFSGLSSNGDELSLFNTDPNVPGAVFELIDFVEIPPAPLPEDPEFGASYDYTQLDPSGAPTLSVSGMNGAITASNGDVGSPGFVPETEAVLLGDANLDGIVDFNDIPSFVNTLLGNMFLLEADVNEDGLVDFNDIPAFVAILLG